MSAGVRCGATPEGVLARSADARDDIDLISTAAGICARFACYATATGTALASLGNSSM